MEWDHGQGALEMACVGKMESGSVWMSLAERPMAELAAQIASFIDKTYG